MTVDVPGQHVIERTSVLLDAEGVEARFTVNLPARGRSVLGQWACTILCENIPRIAKQALHWESQDKAALQAHVVNVEDQEALRGLLAPNGLVAFVANGAILPRTSGALDTPLEGAGVVPFQSPEGMQVSFQLPSGREVEGLGIKSGITLIVGGGFHGKSTLLQALEAGVYNHTVGDGREFVVADPNSVKIRAEDGRSCNSVDIRPFINNLPYGKDTQAFTTTNASGSTSQATNIMEAVEVGCSTLLVDEDTCATNFMIRDQRMQRLVAKDREPITPFIYKVKQLYDELGVSTVMVVGGAGDYFDVAHHVIMLEGYLPKDVTAEAKAIVAEMPSARQEEGGASFGAVTPRLPIRSSLSVVRQSKVRVRDVETVGIGEDLTLDLSAVEQLVEASQTRAIMEMISFLDKGDLLQRSANLRGAAEALQALLDTEGLDALSKQAPGNLARPRVFEFAAALNRLRAVQFKQ